MSDSPPTAGASAVDAANGAKSFAVPQARRVAFGAPFAWLARGWADMRATRFVGAFYGAMFALMGLAITTIYAAKWQLTMGLTAGFFLVGPFICCGIYWLSRQWLHFLCQHLSSNSIRTLTIKQDPIDSIHLESIHVVCSVPYTLSFSLGSFKLANPNPRVKRRAFHRWILS